MDYRESQPCNAHLLVTFYFPCLRSLVLCLTGALPLPLMGNDFSTFVFFLCLGQRLLLFGSNASEFTRSARARTLQLMRRVLLRRRADFARASRCDAHQESACGGGWALAVEG
jgi:hypothetical protein